MIYLIIRNQKLWIKIFYSFLIFLSLFSLSMIQSRASFVAAALIGGLLIFWTSFQFLKSKNIKDFIPNFFYLLPLIFALFLNQILTSDKALTQFLVQLLFLLVSQTAQLINVFVIMKMCLLIFHQILFLG